MQLEKTRLKSIHTPTKHTLPLLFSEWNGATLQSLEAPTIYQNDRLPACGPTEQGRHSFTNNGQKVVKDNNQEIYF